MGRLGLQVLLTVLLLFGFSLLLVVIPRLPAAQAICAGLGVALVVFATWGKTKLAMLATKPQSFERRNDGQS